MRPAVLVATATLFVACASPPPPVSPAEPTAASATTSLATSAAAPPFAAAPPKAPPVPAEEEPVITKGRIVVPEGKCSGRLLTLEGVANACACKPAKALDTSKRPVCPGEPKSQSEEIPGLVVTVKIAEPRVKTGAKVRATVRFVNRTETAMPLHFIRDRPLELVFLTEDGQSIPVEGKTDCPAMVTMADLAGVTLGPGGEVSTEVSVAATKRKYKAGKDACGTTEGTKLAAGKYQVGIADTPLYGKGQTKTAEIEVVAK